MKLISQLTVIAITVSFSICTAENIDNNKTMIGEVVHVNGTRVRIKVSSTANIHSGFQANLYYQTPFGDKIKTGEWRVTGIGDNMIEAESVNIINKPTVGLLANIKESLKKVKIDDSNNHIYPWSKNTHIDENSLISSQKYVDTAKQIIDDIEKKPQKYSKQEQYDLWNNAIINIHKAVAMDNAEAYFLLALIYEDGYGDIKSDMNKMVLNIKKSAEKGFVEAQFTLGDMYADGDEVEKNREKGIYWLKKAAEQGHEDAINKLKYLSEVIPEKHESTKNTETYRVYNVKSWDVLFIRSEPSTQGQKIGSIPPTGKGIRKLRPCQNNWCKISYHGTLGWVSINYIISDTSTKTYFTAPQ